MSATISDPANWRDGMGRPPGAPAWNGDITRLPEDLVHHRIEALGSHLGRMVTRYEHATGQWVAHTPQQAENDYWINQRLTALNELERRRRISEQRRSL